MAESLQEIINKLWNTPQHAEWTPKTDVVALNDIHKWIGSEDIETLGFTHALLHDARFRIEPPISLEEYVRFSMKYYERCLRENPNGQWSSTSYIAGGELVNVFGSLWRDPSVPRSILQELKAWLGQLYRDGDPELRRCLVHATLEHLFEQEPIRQFFTDWKDDKVLGVAHREASAWYRGGGNTPLGKPPLS